MLKIFNIRFTKFGARVKKLEIGEGEKEKFDKLMTSQRELHKLKSMVY